MSNQNEYTKFEFLLKLEEHIIVQRYFNVKDYNFRALNSVNIYEDVKNICEEIGHDLKVKTLDYLANNQNYFLNSDNNDNQKNDSDEYFSLELKLNGRVFIQRVFSAKYYHPKVRYSVDIRPYLKEFLMSLTDTLSNQNVETSYLEYQL